MAKRVAGFGSALPMRSTTVRNRATSDPLFALVFVFVMLGETSQVLDGDSVVVAFFVFKPDSAGQRHGNSVERVWSCDDGDSSWF